MTSSGTDSRKLKRIIVILAIACALLIGVVAGVAITAAMSNTPAPIASGEVTPPIGTVTPTPSATPKPTKDSGADVAQPAAPSCPSGGLTVSFTGMVANQTNGIAKVLAGYRLTNTSTKFAMTITRNSRVSLELLTAAGANKGTIRAINPRNILVDAGGIGTMALTHDGYQVPMWNQSSELHVEDGFDQLEVKWMNSNCKVPIKVGNTSKAIAPFRLVL